MVYTKEEAAAAIIRAGKELVKKGLVARTWGNISARISKDEFMITPSGRAYDELEPADIVIVKINDCSYEGSVKPSSELKVHAKVYKHRPNVGAVIHTHQSYASAISVAGIPVFDLNVMLEDENKPAHLKPEVPVALYGISGSKKLTANVEKRIKEFKNSNAVLMKNHGALCFGESFEETFYVTYELEEASKQIFDRFTGGRVNEYKWDIKRFKKTVNEEGDTEIICSCPYVMEVSSWGETVRPYLDDAAQIAGVRYECITTKPTKYNIKSALRHADAVFVKGRGALCRAENEEEACNVCAVLEKNCMAAYLGRIFGAEPISYVNAALDRSRYVKKYSKLK